ncbi:hypothetical protein D3870_04730 [Noviherbaspirillum cavernae]|uniref:Uncharacterized protein n=2 Tax=Noviherbaspirillum cavernae TaxID=2320862 RepID=A0A418WYT6_9BURK|nr:hypothetical protein D3870_04730 [Noviherbaspirillum cavernae]
MEKLGQAGKLAAQNSGPGIDIAAKAFGNTPAVKVAATLANAAAGSGNTALALGLLEKHPELKKLVCGLNGWTVGQEAEAFKDMKRPGF